MSARPIVTMPSSLPVSVLVLDSTLQCRVGVDEAVVEEYAAAIADGAVFPAVRVVLADEHLVVDGWHRVLAHRKAGREEIAVVLSAGTRRDALLEATRANRDHGLRRSAADKRKAVRTLLMDAEWCQLASRALGELAGTSHAFVAEVRRSYGIAPGQVLTRARAAELDDDLMSPAWAKLLEEWRAWERELRAARCAPTIDAVIALRAPDAAKALRLAELATDPWPWPDDDVDLLRHRRTLELDTLEDLAAALTSTQLPPEAAIPLLNDYAWARRVAPGTDSDQLLAARINRWGLRDLEQRWYTRPRLLARVRELLEHCEQAPPRVDDLARAIEALPTPGAQGAAVRDASDDVVRILRADRLHAEVIGGAYRKRMSVGPCTNPRCGSDGWLARPRWPGAASACWRCTSTATSWRRDVTIALVRTARAVAHPGVGVVVDGLVLDTRALGVLRACRALNELGRLDDLPISVAAAVRDWGREAQFEVLVDPTQHPDDEDDIAEEDDDATPKDGEGGEE